MRKFSVFHLYGRPLIDGIRWGDTLAQVGLIVIFLSVSGLGFSRRDILK